MDRAEIGLRKHKLALELLHLAQPAAQVVHQGFNGNLVMKVPQFTIDWLYSTCCSPT